MNLTNTNKETVNKVVSLFYDWKLYPEFEAIADLQDWSINFEGASPFLVFLDLIGYSSDRFGSALCGEVTASELSHLLGYKEYCLISKALKIFENNGYDPVYDYIDSLINSDRYGLEE
jgi:hypothetical protein